MFKVVISKTTPGVSLKQEQALERPEMMESTTEGSARGAIAGRISSSVARLVGAGAASRFFLGRISTEVATTVTVAS